METTDIVVAGGGIIGLTAALELARSGFHVTLLERGRVMSEASWAAAGMLAAEDPENPPELSDLSALSRNLYPEYLSQVESLSKISVPLRTRGALQATRRGGSFRTPETQTRLAMTRQEAEMRVQGMVTEDRSFLWLEEDSLDPRDLCAALPLAAIAARVTVCEGTEVLGVEAETGGVKVTTRQHQMSAGGFVNCCGAWASTVRHSVPDSDGPCEPVEPRKGQMAMVRLEGQKPLQYVLRTPDVYLVPRDDRRIAVGATVERAGYSREVDSIAIGSMIEKAAEIWPPIASCPVVESWTGLRPGTSDGLPFIGGAGLPHCWLATGHFRNGILLAPATGLVVRQLLQGQATAIDLTAFSVERILPLKGES